MSPGWPSAPWGTFLTVGAVLSFRFGRAQLSPPSLVGDGPRLCPQVRYQSVLFDSLILADSAFCPWATQLDSG